ncbi:MAG TPA: beta-ketoacyl-[acyl-carrier-protein] synthase II, partial [bacterium]|nr:beta-ketoacyl-[acyl-carrier-protein] synthase II [bacterium]
MRERRVVVTGVGAVSPLGNDTKSTWEGLIQGKNGIGPVTRFDTEGIDSKIAAELKDFDPTRYIDFKEARRMDPFTH